MSARSCFIPQSRPLYAWAVTALLAGCAGSQADDRWQSLPQYSVEDAALFGNSLAREIFGLPRNGAPIAEDTTLAERARQADTIAVMKISTITRDNNAGSLSFHLVLRANHAPIAGRKLDTPTIETDIIEPNPAIPLLRGAEDTLIGTPLLVFVKNYLRDGQRVVHFHAEANSDPVISAVKSARR